VWTPGHREFGAAIARAPKPARFHNVRGRAYEAQNKPGFALADYSEVDPTEMMVEPS
jgi:hypothetical protein